MYDLVVKGLNARRQRALFCGWGVRPFPALDLRLAEMSGAEQPHPLREDRVARPGEVSHEPRREREQPAGKVEADGDRRAGEVDAPQQQHHARHRCHGEEHERHAGELHPTGEPCEQAGEGEGA